MKKLIVTLSTEDGVVIHTLEVSIESLVKYIDLITRGLSFVDDITRKARTTPPVHSQVHITGEKEARQP